MHGIYVIDQDQWVIQFAHWSQSSLLTDVTIQFAHWCYDPVCSLMSQSNLFTKVMIQFVHWCHDPVCSPMSKSCWPMCRWHCAHDCQPDGHHHGGHRQHLTGSLHHDHAYLCQVEWGLHWQKAGMWGQETTVRVGHSFVFCTWFSIVAFDLAQFCMFVLSSSTVVCLYCDTAPFVCLSCAVTAQFL